MVLSITNLSILFTISFILIHAVVPNTSISLLKVERPETFNVDVHVAAVFNVVYPETFNEEMHVA